MDPRNEWVAGTDPVDRLVEAVARTLLAAVLWAVMLYAILALPGASVLWFAGLGMVAPLLWLLNWVHPDDEGP